MPIKQFEIRGDGIRPIVGIGLRAQIYTRAYKFSVRVVPQNVSKDLVRVVASGDVESLDSFYKEVLDYCTSEVQLPTQNISGLEDYHGLEPEWFQYDALFTNEQMAKSVDSLEKTYQMLGDMDKKFGAIGVGLNESKEKLDEIVIQLKPISDIEKTLKELNSNILTLIMHLPN